MTETIMDQLGIRRCGCGAQIPPLSSPTTPIDPLDPMAKKLRKKIDDLQNDWIKRAQEIGEDMEKQQPTPKWSVSYDIPNKEYVGTGWEFFDSYDMACARFHDLTSKFKPSLMPFNEKHRIRLGVQ